MQIVLLRSHAPIACKHTGSGLFTPLPGYFSPFPHGTIHYRSSEMFSLRAWSPQIQPEFHVLRPTQELNNRFTHLAYGTITLFSQLFQYCAAMNKFCNCLKTPQIFQLSPITLNYTTPAGLHVINLGCIPFAHHYSGHLFDFFYVKLLRCFTSLALPLTIRFQEYS